MCRSLFADDTVLVADSEDEIAEVVEEFGRVCERRKLKMNVNKSKVMQCYLSVDEGRLNVSLNRDMLEDVDHFKYVGSHIGR